MEQSASKLDPSIVIINFIQQFLQLANSEIVKLKMRTMAWYLQMYKWLSAQDFGNDQTFSDVQLA